MSPLELKLGHFDLKSESYILIFDMLVSAHQDTKSTLEAKPRNEKFLPMNTDTLKPSCQVASNKKHHQDQYCCINDLTTTSKNVVKFSFH